MAADRSVNSSMQPRASHVGIRGERVSMPRPPESGAWFLVGVIGLAIGIGAGGVTVMLAISDWSPTGFEIGVGNTFSDMSYFKCQVLWWLQWSLCAGWIVLRHGVARLRPWAQWLLGALLALASWGGAWVIWEVGYWLW
ncbi:MAG: hypothetical protein KIS87_00955 [Phycisphaeraceae bacterium]|nr:hypothetical protein [Phycisphaeraceae bacterium]